MKKVPLARLTSPLESFGVSQNLRRKTGYERVRKGDTVHKVVHYSSAQSAVNQARIQARTVKRTQNVLNPRAKQRQAEKEFFADLLTSAATKRDAKAYLSRLKPSEKGAQDRAVRGEHRSGSAGHDASIENLFFGRTRATEESPRFWQEERIEKIESETLDTLHIALVKLSNAAAFEDDTLDGIAQTLSQLARLSLTPCVVLDVTSHNPTRNWRQELFEQADRVVSAIESDGEVRARRLDNIFEIGQESGPGVSLRTLLTRPLRQGQIPVVVPIAYSSINQSAVPISADEAMIALTKELAGLNVTTKLGQDPYQDAARLKYLQRSMSVDKIILIDEIGGITGPEKDDSSHVFVNLEQEYGSLLRDLESGSPSSRDSSRHAANLKLLHETLQYLPPTSSGLISTPEDAANLKSTNASADEVQSVGTRRQKNALIHNLLTDKPAYSSSLPQGRLQRDWKTAPVVVSSTFVKRGMPVTIIPDPRSEVWRPEAPRIQLTDSRIDLTRLVHLIDDSFNRKLDVQDYLNRVNSRIAGVIIAGEYEGGALLTWETPPGATDDDSPRLVPYLDKFAVLKRSQGAGGVADIVFNAMVRDCFPEGVCWRSRKNNPVNKWYFERSRGTWKIPDMNWTMFWTTPGAAQTSQLFMDYEGVCRGVQPSWADRQKPAD